MEVNVKQLGVVPIALEFLESLGFSETVDRHLPSGKEEISHGQVLKILVLNILDGAEPLYKVSDWLSGYSDGLGLSDTEEGAFSKYHDKRLGASLDALYDADRHSLLTDLSSCAMAAHELMNDRIHQDLTRISFTGVYAQKEDLPQDLSITGGYHPSLKGNIKQVVFGMSLSSDGAVPLWYDLHSGNTADSTTYADTWTNLKQLINRSNFTYIGDSKLAEKKTLALIANNGGHFITILPANRKEVQDFKTTLQEMDQVDWLKNRPCDWSITYEPEKKTGQKNLQKYRLKQGEKSEDGYPILWVYSESKAEKEQKSRNTKIEKQVKLLTQLNEKKINKRKLKSKEAIIAWLEKNIPDLSDYIDFQIIEKQEVIRKKKGRGPIGIHSQFEEITQIKYELVYQIKKERVAIAARTDGLFPLIHNKKEQKPTTILKEYKEQPYLENRFKALKSTLRVTPMFLEKTERIEAMLFLYFIALMIIALIERRIRNNMVKEKIEKVSILPQNKTTTTPTWSAIKYLFATVFYVVLKEDKNHTIRYQLKGLHKRHKIILKLLEIDLQKYQPQQQRWWQYQPT